MHSKLDDFGIWAPIMLIPVVLSGGAGSRLWPVSREGHPKPFMKLADGQSLLLKTYIRAGGVALSNDRDGELITVTNRDYYFMSKDELAKAGMSDRHQGVFLLEPMGRIRLRPWSWRDYMLLNGMVAMPCC